MRRSFQRSKLVDLTPLLDVVLILLFALMMVISSENDAARKQAKEAEQEGETYRQKAVELQENVKDMEAQINQYEALLERYPLDTSDTALTLTQMEYIAQGYVLINVSVDSADNSRLYVNQEETNILIDTSLRGDSAYVQGLKSRIQDELIETMQQEGRSKNVLVTLIQDASMTVFAYELIEDAVNDLDIGQGDAKAQLMIYQDF